MNRIKSFPHKSFLLSLTLLATVAPAWAMENSKNEIEKEEKQKIEKPNPEKPIKDFFPFEEFLPDELIVKILSYLRLRPTTWFNTIFVNKKFAGIMLKDILKELPPEEIKILGRYFNELTTLHKKLKDELKNCSSEKLSHIEQIKAQEFMLIVDSTFFKKSLEGKTDLLISALQNMFSEFAQLFNVTLEFNPNRADSYKVKHNNSASSLKAYWGQ